MRPIVRFLSVLLAALLVASPVYAAYPEKPIKLIVPFSPGGTTDILARILANRLGTSLGQSVIVENRPGAAGNIGADIVAKAKPDGYTLLIDLMNTHVSNPALYPDMPFKGVDDFTPIAMLGYVTTTMVINPSLPAKNVAEFIAYAKAHPGKVTYASAGVGSSTHLNAAVFAKMAGIELLHVPYKGGAPALQDTIAGRTDVLFTAANITLPQIKSGAVRLLGVTRSKRAAILPDTPTIAETLPGYDMAVWYGALGPANMPRDIVTKLNVEINRIMSSAEERKTMDDAGVEVVNDTPEQFGAIMRKDLDFYSKLLRELNIKAE
jgi:tripartite-type tricarboxylate transporter receptor subunit TctC